MTLVIPALPSDSGLEGGWGRGPLTLLSKRASGDWARNPQSQQGACPLQGTAASLLALGAEHHAADFWV